MQPREFLYLHDMIQAADAVSEFINGETRDSFVSNDLLRTAVVKKLEIMGEAARALPDELKQRHPEIPWRQMIGMRHVGVHRYFSINWDLVWHTATVNVPLDRSALQRLVASEFPDIPPRDL